LNKPILKSAGVEARKEEKAARPLEVGPAAANRQYAGTLRRFAQIASVAENIRAGFAMRFFVGHNEQLAHQDSAALGRVTAEQKRLRIS
jgi:hypothetical protein